MPAKTTGAEFKRFYNDKTIWTEDAFHEGEVITINGVEQEDGAVDYSELNDADIITVAHGVVYGDASASTEIGSMEGLFRKWKRRQTTETLLVEAPREKVDAILSAIRAAGGKVSRL